MTRPFIFDFDGTLVNSENAIYQSFYEITKELAPDRIEFVKKIIHHLKLPQLKLLRNDLFR